MHTTIAKLSPVQASGAFTMADDGQVIRVAGCGLVSIDNTDRHFEELERTLIRARSQSRQIRVLVDLRAISVQSHAVAERIAFWTKRVFRQEDRVAIIVASSIVKAQMRRVAFIAQRETFLSETAAGEWLLAYS